MVTNAEVQRMYHHFNKKYFGNRLPKDMIVDFNRAKDYHGRTAFYKTRPLHIQIGWHLRDSNAHVALTLLHEMVHVELPARFNHGPRFHKRMLKLAKQGAMKPWW